MCKWCKLVTIYRNQLDCNKVHDVLTKIPVKVVIDDAICYCPNCGKVFCNECE